VYDIEKDFLMGFIASLLQLFGSDKAAPKGYKAEDVSKGGMSDGVISHLEFTATMQLRTPLDTLNYHGSICSADGRTPPFQALMADGIWLPVVDDAFSILRTGATMASDIGPIPYDDKEYLTFLTTIRSAVEQVSNLTDRRKGLYIMLKDSPWPNFVASHGGVDSIVDKFFPMFITTISGLPKVSQDCLVSIGCVTPKAIGAMDDRALLSINGIGPAKLSALRLACDAATDPEAEYIASAQMNIV
jgi:hypothetical protein